MASIWPGLIGHGLLSLIVKQKFKDWVSQLNILKAESEEKGNQPRQIAPGLGHRVRNKLHYVEMAKG